MPDSFPIFGAHCLPPLQPDIAGLAWRNGTQIVINPDRPFIPSLDDLPIPLHHLLPLDRQRMPLIRGPFTCSAAAAACSSGNWPSGCRLICNCAVRRFERFVANPDVQVAALFEPCVLAMQASLSHETAYLILDCTQVGRRCRTPMAALA